MNIDFKINDTVKIIGDIQGWTNRTGVIKSIHGVDFIVSCGSTEDYDILVMKREIEHYNPENESDFNNSRGNRDKFFEILAEGKLIVRQVGKSN